MRLASQSRTLKRAALLAVVAGASLSGLVAAQPAPKAAPAAPTPAAPPVAPTPVAPTPIAPLPAPGAPVTEEAPPIDVPTPAPIVVPPITEKEVAPAPPKEEVVAETPETPTRRARYDVAILQALDKVTAESLRFEAAVGRPVRYKNLVFTVRACERSAPEEPVEDSIAYISIEAQPRAVPGKATPPARQAFRGWMFASSPSLNPMEHPVYDAWLISCRASAPAVAAGSRPNAASTSSARPSLP